MKTIRFTAKSTPSGFQYRGACACGHVGEFHWHERGLVCVCGTVHEYVSPNPSGCDSLRRP